MGIGDWGFGIKATQHAGIGDAELRIKPKQQAWFGDWDCLGNQDPETKQQSNKQATEQQAGREQGTGNYRELVGGGVLELVSGPQAFS